MAWSFLFASLIGKWNLISLTSTKNDTKSYWKLNFFKFICQFTRLNPYFLSFRSMSFLCTHECNNLFHICCLPISNKDNETLTCMYKSKFFFSHYHPSLPTVHEVFHAEKMWMLFLEYSGGLSRPEELARRSFYRVLDHKFNSRTAF